MIVMHDWADVYDDGNELAYMKIKSYTQNFKKYSQACYNCCWPWYPGVDQSVSWLVCKLAYHKLSGNVSKW